MSGLWRNGEAEEEMTGIFVDCSYDPNSWKQKNATDLASLEPGGEYVPGEEVGGICCDCRSDRTWSTTGLAGGVYTLICHTCKTDHTAIVPQDHHAVRNQVRVGDGRWYFVEKKQ